MDNNSVLLARIDERTKNIEKKLIEFDLDLKDLRKKTHEDFFQLKKELRENYIDIHQFNPVQRAVYTAISVIVLAVGAAILNLVIPKA